MFHLVPKISKSENKQKVMEILQVAKCSFFFLQIFLRIFISYPYRNILSWVFDINLKIVIMIRLLILSLDDMRRCPWIGPGVWMAGRCRGTRWSTAARDSPCNRDISSIPFSFCTGFLLHCVNVPSSLFMSCFTFHSVCLLTKIYIFPELGLIMPSKFRGS